MRSQALVEFGAPLEEIETPTPVPTGSEVLLRICNSGVCHTDIHLHEGYFDLGSGKKLALNNLSLPHTLGHEIEGEVVAAGPGAAGVKIGEHYAVYPWIGCGDCPACRRDEENLCVRARSLGCSAECPGGYATHVLVPHPKYLLDYGQTPPALAAISMCSGLTAFSAIKKVGTPGAADEVVVLGCGGVGLMAIRFARSLFGKAPIAADIDAARLDAAYKAGAKAVYNTREQGAAKKLIADTSGGAFAVVDFVGSETSFAFANSAVRKGGRIVIVGLFGGAMTMPLPLFPLRAISLVGSYVGTLPEAREMMAIVRVGKVEPIPLTMRPLAEVNESLADLKSGHVVGRVVLTP